MKRLKFDRRWPEKYRKLWRNDSIQMWNPKFMPLEYIFYQYRLNLILSWVETIHVKRILDVGAAQGNFSLLLAEKGFEVVMNDIDRKSLEYAMLKYEKGHIQELPGDIMKIEPKKTFDLILLLEILEHVAKPLSLLKRVRQWLEKSGHIFITTPNGSFVWTRLPKYQEIRNYEEIEKIQYGPDAEDHLFVLTPEELKSLIKDAGFHTFRHELFGTPFMKGWFKIRYLVNIIPNSWLLYLDRIFSKNAVMRHKLCVVQAVMLKSQ